ncbi:hypothetical protein [Aureimonas fodinaquatilis]|nr:hypothetical protein [Aureimonas fodinaquatilis]
MKPKLNDEARAKESAAILKRLREETEPQIGANTEKMLLNVQKHFTAGDADQNDRIEVVGTRIGRLAGLGFFLFLVASLVVTYLLP